MPATINSANYVDNKPICEAVERAEYGGMTASTIAQRLGWTWGGKGDATRLSRRLGRTLNPHEGHLSHALRYDLAVAIIRAIDRDPVDFDL